MRFVRLTTVWLTSISLALATSQVLSGCSSPSGTGATPSHGGSSNTSSGGSGGIASGGMSNSSGGASSSAGGAGQGGSSNQGGTSSGGNATANGGSTNATGGSGNANANGGTAGAPTQAECGAMPTGSVTFSAPSGTFQGSLSVQLTTTTSGAEIRYTTDHSAPNASSPLYNGAITISATTELIAQAFVQGVGVGEAQAAVYIARDFDATHDLPVIVLDSYGKALPQPAIGGPRPGGTGGAPGADENIRAGFLSFEPNNGTTSLSTAPKVASVAGFHIRGQSSASYDKKPYRVELRKVDGSDRNCTLLGMPRESDWVLHAPFPDKALIRNAFVYSLGRDIGIPAPRGAFAEVYVNTANRPLQSGDYAGVYLLVETIKNQKDRLNLQQLKTTDTTLPAIGGGYIFQFQWQVNDIEQTLKCPTGQQNCWNWIEVKDPNPWVQQQTDYLTQYLVQFVNALHSTNPSDPNTGYPAFLDTASVANQIIVHELTRNMDAYVRSQYFYKDRDGKLTAGPLWDYDLIAGVGTSTTYANMSPMGFQYESNATRITATADWFPRLLADPAFKATLVARWKELRQNHLSNDQITARITRLTTGLSAGAQRNFQRWPNLTTVRIGFFDTPTANSWDGQVAAMRDWLLTRVAWLDQQWQ
ncbi:MAG: CotH kinase family protein [Myxococcota bacterium]